MRLLRSDLGYGYKVGVEEDVGDVICQIYCRQVEGCLFFTLIKCNIHYGLMLDNWRLFKLI